MHSLGIHINEALNEKSYNYCKISCASIRLFVFHFPLSFVLPLILFFSAFTFSSLLFFSLLFRAFACWGCNQLNFDKTIKENKNYRDNSKCPIDQDFCRQSNI